MFRILDTSSKDTSFGCRKNQFMSNHRSETSLWLMFNHWLTAFSRYSDIIRHHTDSCLIISWHHFQIILTSLWLRYNHELTAFSNHFDNIRQHSDPCRIIDRQYFLIVLSSFDNIRHHSDLYQIIDWQHSSGIIVSIWYW